MNVTKAQQAYIVMGDPKINFGYGVQMPDTGVGYTQGQALHLLRKAFREPGRSFEVYDMCAQGVLPSARNVADRISAIMHQLSITHVVKMKRYGTKYTLSVDPIALAEWLSASAFVFEHLVELPAAEEPVDTIDELVPGRAKFAELIERGRAAREPTRPLSALEGKFTEKEIA